MGSYNGQNKINDLNKDKKILEMAVNGDPEKIVFINQFGLVGENLKLKDNIIKIDSKTNQLIGNEKVIKIGVIGNSTKGKSFLLSKISKIQLPSGTSIRTEGLSIKYPDLIQFKDRKIALLDSAGLETPVLKIDKNIKEEKINEYFKEKSREKLITELFLQNYIINNSNVLIVVVGILTYSEQKLLMKIKKEIERSKLKIPLFIIHNLITYTSIQQVKEYINEFLLNSATFTLSSFIFASNFKIGVSSPAEVNKAILLSLNICKSRYLILSPSVLIVLPGGNSILDILERRKDFPLFEFPITPILMTFSFLNFS